MKDVKNKFFAPYMIISFVLFLASFFLSMTSELIKTNLDIFVLVGFGFSLLFTILMESRIKTDKIYSIIFVLLMIIAEVFFGLLDKALLGSIFFILSFTSFLIRLINEYDNHKLAFYIGVSLISISSIILSIFIDYFSVIGISTIIVLIMIFLVIIYKNKNVLYRPNWFLGGMGLLVFLLFIVSYTLDQIVPDTALVKSMLGFASKAFLIPSLFLTISSYTLLETKNNY